MKDPFIKLWKDNYNTNILSGFFSKENSRPLMFLVNNQHYYGRPVVLVAAGPSIDKNIKYLKDYQDKCVIICADVILFKLAEHGIKPHFVVNVDPHESITRFWKFIDTSDLTLVCPTTTHPKTISTWEGNIFLYNQVDIRGTEKGTALKQIIKNTAGYGNLLNRFFVGATMLQLAALINATTTILVGFDVAFSDNKAYCDGFLNLKIINDGDTPGTPEYDEGIRILKSQEIIKDYEITISPTKSVWTSRALRLYKKTFLDLVYILNMNVVNATEGGILTEVASAKLENILKDVCISEVGRVNVFALKKRKKRK
jgi:hypothetical protein